MYSTLLLRDYQAHIQASDQRDAALFSSPGGPHTAWLLLQHESEEEPEMVNCCCMRFPSHPKIQVLPFPQDVTCVVHTTRRNATEKKNDNHYESVYFLPVLGKSISSNTYYVVHARGRSKGLVATCSSEEDVTTCCICCSFVREVPPRRLEPSNPYQQIQIEGSKGGFFKAKCVAEDGTVPYFLRRGDFKRWDVRRRKMELGGHESLEAVRGGNEESCARVQPSIQFVGLGEESPLVVAGQWYTPFIFVQETAGPMADLGKQADNCPFYTLTLEKLWECIHLAARDTTRDDDLTRVHMTLATQEHRLLGLTRVGVETSLLPDGSMTFRHSPQLNISPIETPPYSLTLQQPLVRGMFDGRTLSHDASIDRRFPASPLDSSEFAVYVMAERFSLRRFDGTMVLTSTFRQVENLFPKHRL